MLSWSDRPDNNEPGHGRSTIYFAVVVLLWIAIIIIEAIFGPKANASTHRIPPHKFITTAPARTSNEDLLGAGWTDKRTGVDVRQNMWGCQSDQSICGRQTLWANSSSNWGIISHHPKGNLRVLAYPSTQQVFTSGGNPTPISKFSLIRSGYKIKAPHHGTYEFTYDIWLNGGNTEMMIWFWNHGQVPAGDPRRTYRWYGETFTLWTDYPHSCPCSFVLHGNKRADTVHILSAIRALRSYKPLRDYDYPRTLNDIEGGIEIASDGGFTQHYTFLRYRNYVSQS
jgi:hypothetical protein